MTLIDRVMRALERTAQPTPDPVDRQVDPVDRQVDRPAVEPPKTAKQIVAERRAREDAITAEWRSRPRRTRGRVVW
jgi:hypothetical protein